jgi:hypothetical protein
MGLSPFWVQCHDKPPPSLHFTLAHLCNTADWQFGTPPLQSGEKKKSIKMLTFIELIWPSLDMTTVETSTMTAAVLF